ncbi:hypothetical protein BDB00DRAFT_807570 [Zychaea mexicana]|uniref:uncharacterized protein n=1 Tax=Zychaea mexicana TaxID=64656 RepID=UPI0022FE2E3C|nr:uncharacterized protein BDB00DRAFT_807570 [Zychaea mexicana]KAI9496862.1 hypothetical protein BDB00DRAFT_807570 [Zychaea mexicana]
MVSTIPGSFEQQLAAANDFPQTTSDSSPDWSIDDNAQELLNEAIASNYRSQDPSSDASAVDQQKRIGSKRKSAAATAAASKLSDDSSTTSSSSADNKRTNNKASATGPKRAGRRPLEKTVLSDAPLDPKQKRKEQNRAAQRAFRERKERHVSELQDRIRELEEENASHSHLAKENARLKEQLRKLQEENYSLKGTPFTFEFPPKAAIIHEDEYQYRSSNSTSSSSCGSLSITGDKTSSSSPGSSNNSERSSSGESPSMTLDHLSSLEEDDEQQQGNDLQHQQQHQPADITITTTTTTATNDDQQQQQQSALFGEQPFSTFQNSQELSIDDLLAPFASNTGHLFDTPTNKDHNQFAFTDYRVPQSADSFLFQADLPPLFGGDVDLFGLSAPAPNNDNIDPTALNNNNNNNNYYAQPDSSQQDTKCQVLMKSLRDNKTTNPSAYEIDRQLKDYCPDFDLDHLCWELKDKAKCSEERFNEKDMGIIIDYLEKKDDKKCSA